MGDNRRDSKDSRQIGVFQKIILLELSKILFWPISRLKIVENH
ncbi:MULTISPECIES: hypothetical protein [Bacillaceae]|nr:hypothetical protein [Bacillus sp. Au-Bac7]